MVRPMNALPPVFVIVVLTTHDRAIAHADRKVPHLIEIRIDLDPIVVPDIDEDIPMHPAARALGRPHANDGPAKRDLGMIHMRVLHRQKSGVVAGRGILREDRRGKQCLAEDQRREEFHHAAIFAILGLVILCVTFVVIDRLTPYHLWQEINEKQNMALAIVIGAFSLGIAIIIAASVHG